MIACATLLALCILARKRPAPMSIVGTPRVRREHYQRQSEPYYDRFESSATRRAKPAISEALSSRAAIRSRAGARRISDAGQTRREGGSATKHTRPFSPASRTKRLGRKKRLRMFHQCVGHGGQPDWRWHGTERALQNVRHSSDLNSDNTRFLDHMLIRDCCILWILASVAPPFDRILHYPEDLEPWTYECIANPLQFVSDDSTDEQGRST